MTNPICPTCNVQTKRVGAKNKALPPRYLCPSCGEVWVPISGGKPRKHTQKREMKHPFGFFSIFKVNRDFIDDGKLNGRYFIMPVAGLTPIERKEAIEWFEQSPKIKMRLRDDDGEVYFHISVPVMNANGYTADGLHQDSDITFTPLDSFGVNYGCTTLDVYENGKYVPLN
jgi:hypothetical protein